MLPLLLSTLLLLNAFCVSRVAAASSAYEQQQSSSSQPYDATSSRRDRNLDHWDAPTLSAYLGLDPITAEPLPSTSNDPNAPLDTYAGHDATILFYAQWCQNCHAMAPTYDAIGTHLHAGSTKSNLIMALFDCERDQEHTNLCIAAGIKHYPTVMFVGSGPMHDTDPITSTVLGRDRSAGPAGATPKSLRRAVKFQGDFRYPDQLLDWIKAMRSLSRWHRLNGEGFLGAIRRSVFGLFRKRAVSGGVGSGGSNSLPVGVPPHMLAASASAAAATGGVGTAAGIGVGGGAEAAALQRQVTALEAQVQEYAKSSEDISKAALHATYVIDAVLFPTLEGSESGSSSEEGQQQHPPYSDAFKILSDTGGWGAHPPPTATEAASASAVGEIPEELTDSYLLRTCVVDLTLDYCTRVSSKVTTDYLDEITQMPEAEYPNLSDLDALLSGRTEDVEPYCATFDMCYGADFAPTECRPVECPFKNEVACRYVAACFGDLIREEYREALTPKQELADDEGNMAAAGAAGTTGGTGAWGFA